MVERTLMVCFWSMPSDADREVDVSHARGLVGRDLERHGAHGLDGVVGHLVDEALQGGAARPACGERLRLSRSGSAPRLQRRRPPRE